VPANVKRDLRLDRDKSWVVVTELNRFQWPGPDVRVVGDGTPFYGAIPDWLFVRVREAIGAVASGGRMRVTKRTD
jgi:hypothetical protein